MPAQFAFDGRALTIDEFATYLSTYNFGTIPPDYTIIHSTEIPGATWAPAPNGSAPWDGGEAGLNIAQIKAKRMAQLAAIRDYYRDTNKWTAGPHLFVDDKFVYLFTPMEQIGVHSAEGNSYHDAQGRLHYALALEVVGYYEKVRWPAAIEKNAGAVVALLQRRLKTFDLTFGPKFKNISLHRNYNKPECPGTAITPEYVIATCTAAAAALDAKPARTPVSVHPRLLAAWQMSGGIWQKDRLTPGLPTATAVLGKDGMLYQKFERSVARLKADGGVDWLLLNEIATLITPNA